MTTLSRIALVLLAVVSQARADRRADALNAAHRLGAPMKAVNRALVELDRGVLETSREACLALVGDRYARRDVITIFDLSKPSSQKRFFVLNLSAGTASAYLAAHGSGNGHGAQAKSFRGFNSPISHKTPLGALITVRRGEVGMKREFPRLMTLRLEGTKDYNNDFNTAPSRAVPEGASLEVHPARYVSETQARGGRLGNSDGCIALDPYVNDEVIRQIEGGSLVYVAVGDTPVENFISVSDAIRAPHATKCFED